MPAVNQPQNIQVANKALHSHFQKLIAKYIADDVTIKESKQVKALFGDICVQYSGCNANRNPKSLPTAKVHKDTDAVETMPTQKASSNKNE